MQKISLQTIADMMQVSKVTVSKALNDKEGVSEVLREQIKQTATSLGYQINMNAKALKSNQSYNIGVLIPERYVLSSNTYYFGVYAKLTSKLSNIGYTSTMETLDKNKEKNLILPMMYQYRKIDALIIMGECHKDYLSLFIDSEIPVIFFDFYSDSINIDSIVTDNFYSGFALTRLLIEKGHQKIGFVGNIYSTTSIKDRFLGYYRALLDYNIVLNNNFILSDRDDQGVMQKVLIPEELPTAIVCNNDQIAYALINELKANNYNVPEEISVVAFDNTLFSELGDVKITSVDTNVEQMVEVVSKMVIKKINNPTKRYDRVLIKGFIVERDSVRENKGGVL